MSGGTLSAGILDYSGNSTLFNWTAGTLNLTNSSITFDSTLAPGPSAPFNSSFTLGSGQALNITDNETIANAGPGSLTLNSGSSHSVGGTITLNTGGTFTQNAGSTFTFGSFIQNGGTINAAFDNVGNFVHNDGAINGSFTNDGTLNLTGSIVAAPVTNNSDGMIIGPGTISGAFANSGTLNVPNGTTKVGSFTNNGVIEMAGSAANLGPGGTVTNVSVIEGFGKISDTIVNNGTIQPINGSLTISGNLTNSSTGLISAGAGTNLLVSSGLNTNAGLLSLTGGIFDNGGTRSITPARSPATAPSAPAASPTMDPSLSPAGPPPSVAPSPMRLIRHFMSNTNPPSSPETSPITATSPSLPPPSPTPEPTPAIITIPILPPMFSKTTSPFSPAVP